MNKIFSRVKYSWEYGWRLNYDGILDTRASSTKIQGITPSQHTSKKFRLGKCSHFPIFNFQAFKIVEL